MKEKSIQLRTVCLLSIVVLLLSLVLIVPMQKAQASVADLLQEYWVISSGCSGMGHAGNTWHAQTFTANSTYNLTAIELQFIRDYGATGSLTVSIRNTDGSGYPTGPDLAISNPVSVDGLTEGACSTVYFDFNSPYLELTNGVKYAIVAQTFVGSGVVFIGYYNPGGYAPGEAFQSFNAGGGWMYPDNSNTFDLLFRIYGEGTVPPSDEEPPVEVGGEINRVDKLAVLAPWLALAAVILAGTVIAARRYRVRS